MAATYTSLNSFNNILLGMLWNHFIKRKKKSSGTIKKKKINVNKVKEILKPLVTTDINNY